MPTPSDLSVCICIAAYNAEGTIARAISSALEQGHVAEVIVVDDASTDATIATARDCDDGTGRLRVLKQASNQGPSAARNLALQLSQAEIFCVLDSDDFLLPGRMERLLASDLGYWDFLADDILIVPEKISTQHPVDALAPPVQILDLDLPAFVLGNISRPRAPRAELGFLKPLMRRRFLDAHNLTYDPNMRLGEDYALYVRALMSGARFKVSSFCGYLAIERSSSLSALHGAVDLSRIQAFDATCGRTAGLSEAGRFALADHQRATTEKWALARVLEIRREQGIGPALRFLTAQRSSARYVLTEILYARTERLFGQSGVTQQAREPRFLIGEQEMGIADAP